MRSTTIKMWMILLAAVAGALALTPAVASAAFGISSFSASVSTSQAGAHADVTTAFDLNAEVLGNPIGQLRNAEVTLPPGVIGNPNAIERCSIGSLESFACGRGSQVGVLGLRILSCEGVSAPLITEAEAGATTLSVEDAESFCSEEKDGERAGTITIGSGASAEEAQVASVVNDTTLQLLTPLVRSHSVGETITHIAKTTTATIPLYNVEPSQGHLATFAASLLLADVFVQVNLKSDGRLTATIGESSTLLDIQGATLTLWGVPAAAGHNAERCNELTYECGASPNEATAFLTNPSDCATTGDTELNVSSWQGGTATSSTAFPSMTGCEALSITPSLMVTPTTTQPDTPAGYEVTVRVPQEERPYELATPTLAKISVTLPDGTSLSPGVTNGLVACTDASLAASICPSASRIGTAEVDTPLLNEHLLGGIFIGTPTAAEKYRVFVSVSADNTTVNLEGRAEANETSGQVTAIFADLPQLPVSKLRLDFYGGPTAAFANPRTCGLATSTSQITSYAGQTATPSSAFTVSAGGEGATCASLPFAPAFTAGTTLPLAGRFTPLTLALAREDGQQELSSLTAQLPPGLLAVLSQVPPCVEPQASTGQCPASSQIGTVTLAAGAGTAPLHLSGSVYLTGRYMGAPFGLSIAVPATVGPFDFGTIAFRAQILVSSSDMHLTIVSDPLPQVITGIPLRLRNINLIIGRSGFVLNPTNCDRQPIDATITSTNGAIASASVPFAVAGCSSLPFDPRLDVSTHAAAKSWGSGASLAVQITMPAGPEANISSVKIALPVQLRPRLTTIQDACAAKTFDAHPASCPAGALIGTATVRTSLLSSALVGSVILVARTAGALPELAAVLEAQGIQFVLHGLISISSIETITADFREMPDVPLSLFRLSLRSGRHSLLGPIAKLCESALIAPYTITGQNRDTVSETAHVAVDGCRRRRREHAPARSGTRGARIFQRGRNRLGSAR